MTPAQRIVVAALVLLLLLTGFWVVGQLFTERPSDDRQSRTPVATSRPDQTGGVVGLFVEPDDGREPILAELDNATASIDLEVYLLSDPEILNALEAAVARGVRVRVIMEEQPFGGAGTHQETFTRLESARVAVRWSNPTFRFTHIKTFVIDKRVAIIMNLNLTRSSFTKNREFGVIVTRPAEVAQAAAIFEADWTRGAEPPDGPLVVSPTTSREDLLTLIDGATETIDVYAEVVRDPEIVTALLGAEERGAEVRLMVSADSDANDRGREERAMLTDGGVEVRLASGVYIHAKMILVDDASAYVGSQNFTATSLDQNRELGIILDQPANIARLGQTFDDDFANGKRE